MPDLDFHVQSIEPAKFAVSPLLMFKLKIDQLDGATQIHTVALHCQIRLEPARRRYNDSEEQRLLELFGQRERWGQTMRSMLWTHADAMVPGFTSSTVADLAVPCTFDFNVAMTKYFDALDEGEVPLSLLFSGTIFYNSESGALQAAPISWEKEASARLPAKTWRDMMQHYYPNTAWLCLNKDLFDRLHRYKTAAGQVCWEAAIESLLQSAQQEVPG